MNLTCQLQKKFERCTIDLSFEMRDELVVLFGYSGAGKTVTLKMLAGLLRPDAGSILFNETHFYSASKKVCLPPQERRIGYVFQDHNLFPHMTVKQNIYYGAQGSRRDDMLAITENMLEQFQLHELASCYPAQMSGGQKQRVAFARALACGPELLLLDEPFSALDNPIRMEMRRLLLEIREKFSVPVIMVTHDLGEAVQLADKMVIMDSGVILQEGSAEDVLRSPVNETVAALVSLDNYFPQRLRDMQQT